MREDQRGVALIAAAGVMLLVGILSAVVAAASGQLSEHSADDRNAKRALAAADTGLRRAVFELNQNLPAADECVGTTGNSAPTVGIFCKGHGYLGLGVSYDFYVSQVLNGSPGRSAADCVGLNQRIVVQAGTPIPIEQRCVMAVGCVEPSNTSVTDHCVNDATTAVRGVSRRVQARVGAQTRIQFFPAGLFGNDRLCIGDDWSYANVRCASEPNLNLSGASGTEIDSDIGSNLYLSVSAGIPLCDLSTTPISPAEILLATAAVTNMPGYNSANVNQRNDCPSATPPRTPVMKRVPPYSIPSLERPFAGCSDTAATCTRPASTDTAIPANNNNSVIPGLLAAANCPASAFGGDRELDVSGCPGTGAGTTIALPPGNYNFCRLTMGNKQFVVPRSDTTPPTDPFDPFVNGTGAPVRIFIDSPYRVGSGCGVGNTRADDVAGTSPTLGSDGTTWQSDNTNCPNATPYRCADGSVKFRNGADINSGAAANQALALQFWIYGNPYPLEAPPAFSACKPYAAQTTLPCVGTGGVTRPPNNTLDFENGADATLTLFAPESAVVINNSGGTQLDAKGAIRARSIVVKNGLKFAQDPTIRGQSQELRFSRYYRGPWIECRRKPSSADPRSGC